METKARPRTATAKSPKAAAEPVSEFPDPFAPLRAAIGKCRPADARIRWAVLALFAILVFGLFIQWLGSPFSALIKFAGSGALFMLSGELMRGWMGWEGFWGLILFKDRSTLSWIDRQAQKHKTIWAVLADLGLVLGYGIGSYFLLGADQRRPARLAVLWGLGLPLLFLFSLFIAPVALSILTGLFAHGELGASASTIRASMGLQESVELPLPAGAGGAGGPMRIPVMALLMGALLLLGGLATMATSSLIIYGIQLLPPLLGKILNIAISILSGQPEVSSYVPPPGGAPLLPGINLPLVEGVLALAVLLVVHEMAHGLLARIARVRLDSAGVVFFGVLPFGAFVDPDEKELSSLPKPASNRVLGAGSTANLLTGIAAFMLLTAFVAGTASWREEGWRVNSGPLPSGAIIYSINGVPYEGKPLNLSANSNVAISTSMGEFTRQTDAKGKVGISMGYASKTAAGFQFQYQPGWEWMGFVLTLLGLVFALNIIVGVVNLLPIPLFDGHRLMAQGVGNRLAADALTWLAAGAFVVNFIPWIFK